ncbi:MAG TPA: hypothetical protein VKV41_14905 [Methylomirabilota bacterium]|nr:hypothetical protein [Methylomirabilota bacterium]
MASTSSSTLRSKSSDGRMKIQLSLESDSGAPAASMSSAMTGMRRLFCATAWSISCRHTVDAMDAGLMTNTKACAASMAARIFAIHSSVGRMPCQSTHVSRPRRRSASWSRRTNSWSVRE